MTDGTTTLGDLSKVPRTITVEGVKYQMSPMLVGEIADCAAIMKATARDNITKQMRTTPAGEEAFGFALANLELADINVDKVLNDGRSRVRLVTESINRAGGDPSVVQGMAPGAFFALMAGLTWLSGLAPDATPDPFDDTTGPGTP